MIRGSLLALLGIGSFAVVYIAMGPRAPETAPTPTAVTDQPAQTASVEEPAPQETAPPTDTEPAISFELRPSASESVEMAAAAETDAEPTPARVRNVTPDNMTAGPDVTGPLARLEPAAPEPEPAPEARVERLFNPIVVAASTIKAQGRDIHLAGINAPAFDARCGEGEAAWPCGRMARAALRRFIRGRAIECDLPEGADDIPDPATCRCAGDDIAAWLVAGGWAKRDGDRYGEEENAAREAEIGLWGDGRPGDQADVAANG
jgi:endonuclease YncB( thermonuclease family)